jgi:hypothetical protein
MNNHGEEYDENDHDTVDGNNREIIVLSNPIKGSSLQQNDIIMLAFIVSVAPYHKAVCDGSDG